ncbi:nucleopolyhedrovirus P10 family protein [Streptomyces rectiverticillatus]|uniref:nucleopolyhedrovirus P10 family protein n=1 Tax=Streptomyces rectiverticillatus TaxID=173860 RepID=UPI0015C3D506|nr:nucleopolyhedrovirus P10 family protein [Streptomyces rectiverticillatus]QLE71509.1 nucleopolyhedrovirus P10 family protein [Streptomyces rectiverticillatus]
MAADQWAQTVRRQLALGRLLPLGGAADGAWITESAAVGVLRRATHAALPAVRLNAVRIALTKAASPPAVPPPPSALPPGPLRIEAECATTADVPFPETAARLRAVLGRAAAERIGLRVEAIDLRLTELLDDRPSRDGRDDTATAPPPPQPPPPAGQGRDPLTRAALSVRGVSRATLRTRGGDHVQGDHVQTDIAVTAERRALDVARDVRTAVTGASAQVVAPPSTVSVMVTTIESPPI